MRTRAEIKTEMTSTFVANATVIATYGLDENLTFEQQFSLVSLENIFFDIMSFVVFLHEQIFTKHKSDVNTRLYNQKNGRLPWYRTMALKFQYGFDLIADTDNFDNTNATDEEIAASKIVKYAAVNEAEAEPRIILKIAGEVADELAPINTEQLQAFEAYVEEFKPPGIEVTVINFLPDRLWLNLTIYRDPLVLDENGMSIRNGTYPVQAAIQEFMKELPFNGEFIIQNFIDKLQQVEGVKIAHVNNIESAWIDEAADDYGQPESIPVKKIAESGYFKVVNFDNITYVV